MLNHAPGQAERESKQHGQKFFAYRKELLKDVEATQILQGKDCFWAKALYWPEFRFKCLRIISCCRTFFQFHSWPIPPVDIQSPPVSDVSLSSWQVVCSTCVRVASFPKELKLGTVCAKGHASKIRPCRSVDFRSVSWFQRVGCHKLCRTVPRNDAFQKPVHKSNSMKPRKENHPMLVVPWYFWSKR